MNEKILSNRKLSSSWQYAFQIASSSPTNLSASPISLLFFPQKAELGIPASNAIVENHNRRGNISGEIYGRKQADIAGALRDVDVLLLVLLQRKKYSSYYKTKQTISNRR